MKFYVSQFSCVALLLISHSSVYAQQLVCNPSCSGESGEFISEAERGGELILNNVSLNGIAPAGSDLYPGDPKYDSFAPIVVALGVGMGGVSNTDLNLEANNLNINTNSTLANHARGIAIASDLAGSSLSATLVDSTINLSTTAAATNRNTIGVLMEGGSTGQINNVSLKNTDLNISSKASGNTVGGIWAYGNGFAETNITLDSSNLNIESAAGSAYGIRTENRPNSQNSVITIQDINPGSITVNAYTRAYGISIDTLGKATYIDNKSDINVQASANSGQAYGIYTLTEESIINIQAQNITVKGGSEAYGVYTHGIGNQNITNTGTIKAESSGKAVGIYANSTFDDVLVNSTGDIIVVGEKPSFGIFSDAQNNAQVNVSGNIDATHGLGMGIYSYTIDGLNEINLLAGANIMGGDKGIYMSSDSGDQKITLTQGSQISSKNDLALLSYNRTGSFTVNNSGLITGYADLYIYDTVNGDSITFNNEATGVLDLRNITQSAKNDIVYDLTSPDSTLNNAGLIKFADENFNGTATNAVFNVATFNNSGIIDLTGKNPYGTNDLVGDTFTINGDYVSNGGSIYLNTLLDDASSNGGQGTSDLIVVTGDVTTGSGATKLFITPTASTANLGQLTTGDGIKVIDVQGSSSTNAFQLGRPVVAGTYEYTLGQGQTDDSWYLSSYYKGNGVIQYNPAMGAYLANQTAAVQMFQQTLFDRLIASSEGKHNDAAKNLFWMKTKMTHGSYDSIHGNLSNRTRSYTLQLGGDIALWALDNGGYFHLGVMGGYGDFKDTSKSDTTGTKAEGKLKGYNTGIYGTYFANQDTNLGLYVDLWSQMGWYRNEISGKAQLGTQKYNSTVWSNSVEMGYGIPLTVSGEYQWLATPQVQLTYNHYDVDNQRDKNNLYVSNNNASGLDTRLGIRFHARGIQKDLIEPFLEVNWLNTTAKNKLDFNGKSYQDGFAKDRFEAKVGLQGNINKQWNVSAQMGGQWGNNSFSNYQGQLSLSYKF